MIFNHSQFFKTSRFEVKKKKKKKKTKKSKQRKCPQSKKKVFKKISKRSDFVVLNQATILKGYENTKIKNRDMRIIRSYIDCYSVRIGLRATDVIDGRGTRRCRDLDSRPSLLAL